MLIRLCNKVKKVKISKPKIALILAIVISTMLSPMLSQAAFFSEEEMKKKFTLKVAEGDCTDGQLPGEYSVFAAISQTDCASYCDLNSNCNGYSFNPRETDGKGYCVLRSINDCTTRVPGTSKFYSKNLTATDASSKLTTKPGP